MPSHWNGTLLLFSHGYVPPGYLPTATDAPEPAARAWLLRRGYALAGSSFRNSGWAVEEALADQIQLTTVFRQRYGTPRRTIAWGGSMGGLIAAALVERHPATFSGGLAMCGVMAGAVASWNLRLDAAFAFRTLLGSGSQLDVVHVTDPGRELDRIQQLARRAEATAEGRARLTLVAALADLPGWPGPVQDFHVLRRAELERRASGNPSWNVGVDYRIQLAKSRYRAEVVQRYSEIGLDLGSDLDRLARTPRIAADPQAVAYLSRNTILTGRLVVPMLTVHASEDDQVPVEHEQGYAQSVSAAGAGTLLRQLFVARSGHCGVSTVEALAALQVLIERLDSGGWSGLQPSQLNQRDLGLGGPRAVFTSFQPGPFLRPYPAG